MSTKSVRAAVCGVGLALAWLSAAAIPTAAALPGLAPPLGPQVEQPCNDFDKLAYDPSAGQIVCNGSEWSLSVIPVGVQRIGAACLPDQIDRQFATSDDGYLIYCPSSTGVWGLYQP
ncbi:hypothetical protein [Mycobacterium sp. MMS18-G62]